MRDLSIRGAGDILGKEQSGFIDSIGIDLYLKMLNEAISKSKGEKVISNNDETANNKPLISVATHIDDNYVSDVELKILIHKKINDVYNYNSFCNIKEELEDRFGTLSSDLVIYMYEEWFEKLAKSLQIDDVIDDKKYVSIRLSKEISDKIQGDVLFKEIYDINHNFKLNYKNSSIYIILEKSNLEKHYLMYLIALLIKLRELIKIQ